MPNIRWNPWNIERFFEDDWDLPTIPGISRLVGQGLNLYETDKELVAEAAVPGITEENLDVTVDDNVVRIVGSRTQKERDKTKQRTFMDTLSYSYNYVFRLPQGVITDQEPEIELSDGILTLHFAKVQKTPPKKLTIKRAGQAKEKAKTGS